MGGFGLTSCKGGDAMTTFEALSLMIMFATLVVLILKFKAKR
jgi:hypothetical protein